MKVVMDIVGIKGEVTVQIPIEIKDKKEAIEIAIETVCMIKSSDIEIKEVI